MMRVTVLGTGAMGGGIARNLRAAGHEVTVWNRTRGRAETLAREADVRVADTPRSGAATAELVLGMTRDDAASRAVWTDPATGALGGLAPGALVVESATVSPGWLEELAGLARGAGGRFVAAPVVGSRPQVAARELLVIVAGEDGDVAAARPVLAASARAVHRVGSAPRAAAVAKLVVNGMLAAQIAVVAEMVRVTRAAGIPDETTRALVEDAPSTSPAAARALRTAMAGDDTVNFPVGLMVKDMGYLRDLAAGEGLALPVSDALDGVFRRAAEAGADAADVTGIVPRAPG